MIKINTTIFIFVDEIMCLKTLICQEKLFRFIYKLYITYIKLHYIVFYYLPRLDIVGKKIKKITQKSKRLVETCFGTSHKIFRYNLQTGRLSLFLIYNIEDPCSKLRGMRSLFRFKKG